MIAWRPMRPSETRVLRESPGFSVYLEADERGDAWKKFRSESYNYDFRIRDGLFNRWGRTVETADDPDMSLFGPEILDLEITDICQGVDGKHCQYCYKSNTPNGRNMSLDTFRTVIGKIDYNSQLTQVAFGLGSTASENPDLWAMCDYLRERHIVPNGTVAQLDDRHAGMIAASFGGCAVSYHGSFEILADTVRKLTDRLGDPGGKLAQVNVHFMIAEETYDDVLKLFDIVKSDDRFRFLNAIVLLGLKRCGRAREGFTKLSDVRFENIVKTAFAKRVGLGFDSCQANKFSLVATKMANEKIAEWQTPGNRSAEHAARVGRERKRLDAILQTVEPCEGSCFSAYVNVDGVYYHCSFMEQSGTLTGFDLRDGDFRDYWDGKTGDVPEWRRRLRESGRSCPEYDV